MALSATHAARSSCSTRSWRPASMVSVRSVPGRARLHDRRVIEDGEPARVALRGDDPRLAAELRLVLLLDAVLAAAVTIDETEQVRGEGRVRSATRLRIDALGLRLERQPGHRVVGDGAPDPVGDEALEAVAQDQVLGLGGELVAQGDRLVRRELQDRRSGSRPSGGACRASAGRARRRAARAGPWWRGRWCRSGRRCRRAWSGSRW